MAGVDHAVDRLLVDVLAALGRGKVVSESWLEDHSGRRLLEGCAEPDGTVRVNAATALVPTLLHELVHRVHPEWTERGVSRWATMVYHKLTRPQLERIYELYKQKTEAR